MQVLLIAEQCEHLLAMNGVSLPICKCHTLIMLIQSERVRVFENDAVINITITININAQRAHMIMDQVSISKTQPFSV